MHLTIHYYLQWYRCKGSTRLERVEKILTLFEPVLFLVPDAILTSSHQTPLLLLTLQSNILNKKGFGLNMRLLYAVSLSESLLVNALLSLLLDHIDPFTETPLAFLLTTPFCRIEWNLCLPCHSNMHSSSDCTTVSSSEFIYWLIGSSLIPIT